MEEHVMQEVQTRLQSLRDLLTTEGGHAFLELFDEFMQQREFGLALHVVCDFILAPHSAQVSKSTIDVIRHLHAAMKIDDRCVEEMRNQKMD
jgi:hypothetical protein